MMNNEFKTGPIVDALRRGDNVQLDEVDMLTIPLSQDFIDFVAMTLTLPLEIEFAMRMADLWRSGAWLTEAAIAEFVSRGMTPDRIDALRRKVESVQTGILRMD